VKLLCLLWNRGKDYLTINTTLLNDKADTLRTILASVNSIYDTLGIYLPIKNRAKLTGLKYKMKNLSHGTAN
jgi:hypothetical protein